jgi:oxalate---CoA ligase
VTLCDEPLSAIWKAGEPGAPALVVPDEDTRVSYADLAETVAGLAGALADLGIERGSRVCVSVPNGPEAVELLLAIAALGAAACPLNPAYTVEEFRFYLNDLRPSLLLAPEGELAPAREAATCGVADVAHADGRTVLRGFAPRLLEPAGEAGDVAIVLHTSGTTSRPKQVPLLQQNLVASARSIASHYALSPADVSYVAMPLFHIHGLAAATFATLASGGCVVIPRRLAPRRFHRHLLDHGVTWFSAGPTIHHMLLDRGQISKHGLRLRFTRSCSSALSPELLGRTEEAYGVPILEAYGMTEASHEMTANPLPPLERRAGTVGVPTGAEVRIVDRDWKPLAEGASGEVAVRGPGLTPGYLENPEANAESFKDGWFRTGDLGVLEDGYLRLIGRIKEIIIRGGENISPAEVEDALRSHPAVEDAAVFGVPDEKYGELVAAAVSLRGAVNDHVLLEHCRASLTHVKIPSVIHVLDEIPRTATGKLQRRRIATSIYGS